MEQAAAAPGYWDDPRQAQRYMQQLGRLKDTVALWRNLQSQAASALELVELAMEDDDYSDQEQLEAEAREIRKAIALEEINLTLSGPFDDRPAIVTIHAGAGGTDSQDWAEMLRRMYSKWAENKKCKFEIISEHKGDEAGIKSTTLKIIGPYMYGWLKSESGVHRLVRISPFDSGARRHTSFASVWIYPVIDDSIKISIHEKDIRIDTYRSSGAGGQHVNTTDSAVRITHLSTNIVVQCQNERSQHKNKETCFNMLKARLYEHEIQKKQQASETLSKSKTDIGWGHQIRSYVLQPYQLVKDLRNNLEKTDPDSVLDGDIDDFLEAALYKNKEKKN